MKRCGSLRMSWLMMAGALGLLAGGARARATDSMPNYAAAQAQVMAALSEGQTDLADWVAELRSVTPKDPTLAMLKLAVMIRAGSTSDSASALRELKALSPDLDNEHISTIYYDAGDHFGLWSVARAALETFAANVGCQEPYGNTIDVQNRLIRHLLESGWSVERVDAWLAQMPPGVHGFWTSNRLRFAAEHGRAGALLQEFSVRARQHPENIDAILQFLDALLFSRQGGAGQLNWDPSWLVAEVKPRLATENREIASRLQQMEYWAAAVAFDDRAIAIALTPEEIRKMGMMIQVLLPDSQIKAMFDGQVRRSKAECLLKLGRAAEAQKWMEEAEAVGKAAGVGSDPRFAGRVQAASGARTIESQIRAEEKRSENSPEYWLQRAQYYQGRDEPAQEESALKKGLALSKPQPHPKGKHSSGPRQMLLNRYADFLKRANRPADAVALLRRELETVDAQAESAESAAYLLAFDFEKEVRADDEVLWRWLGNRPQWEYTEERLLWRMLENTPAPERPKYCRRAETLVRGADPSRAFELGWILNRLGDPARSIPLLEQAAAGAKSAELKEKATFTLFESYLDTNDWKHAAQLYPQACKRLTFNEQPDWLSRIAVAAARSGARQDALRIWKRAAGLDPSALGYLDRLARVGLKPELTAFYREMQKRMPYSEFPPRALGMLEK